MSLTRILLLFAGVLALAASPTFATTITLTFDASDACALPPCTDFEPIDQSYGDVAGLVDVTYTSREEPGNSAIIESSLRYWSTGYAGLTDVVWVNSESGVGEIAFSAPGSLITLNSLDLGNFFGFGLPTEINVFRIFNSSYVPLISVIGIDVPDSVPFHFTPPFVVSSTDALIVQFGPEAFNIGLDNLTVTVEAPGQTPEPGSLLLLFAGAAALALRRRKG